MTHHIETGKWEMKEDLLPPKKHFREVLEIYFNKLNVGRVVTVLFCYGLLFMQSNFS